MIPSDRTFSPRELADAIGVSESSVKRWVDAGDLVAARTAGGHRRIALSEAIRFIRARNLTVVLPGALGLADVAQVPPDLSTAPVTGSLLVQLLAGDNAEVARGLVVSAYLRGEPLAPLYDDAVREAMHSIGELWKEDRRGIFVEHRAIDLIVQALSQIRSLIPLATNGAPHAVGGALAGDPYMVPSLMASTVLADAGFHVTHLGPDTPTDVLADAARERGAAIVWLSVSSAESDESIREAVDTLTRRLEGSGAEIVLGGRRAENLELLQRPEVHLLKDMRSLTATARAVLSASGGHNGK